MTEHFDAVIVGAGFSGIGAAIALKRLGYEKFVILDRDDDLGGTWHANHYPGLAVDVPTVSYSYSFEPNPNWSRLYSTGAEIKRYADHVADKYDIRRHMRFNASVEGAYWDEDAASWIINLAGGKTVSSRILVTATGFLSQPRFPDICGVDTFAGTVIHSADWNDDYDPAGRRIAVIGTGASAVQLIPELAQKAADLTVYQRTPVWVIRKSDLRIPHWARRLFARVPLTQRLIRAVSDLIHEVMVYVGVLRYRRLGFLNVAVSAPANLYRFISIRDPQLRRKLTPDYEIGCKQPAFSSDYYHAFTRPNVHLEAGGIERIEPDGLVTADGIKTKVDTLVLATGFDLWENNFPAFEVVGREGCNLGKWWRENGFQAYQGMSIPRFPNFFSLASPYAFLGLNNFKTVDYQMAHIDRVLGEFKLRGGAIVEVTEDANARDLDRMKLLMGDSVFGVADCAGCRSYHYNPHGEPTLARPMTARAALIEARRFPLTDYRFA